MAKIIANHDFKQNGKTYVKGETYTVKALEAKKWARIGYSNEVVEEEVKEEKKAATKK